MLEQLRKVMGVDKNWMPLVKGWNVPTGETIADHIITWLSNIFGGKGTTLACGHRIPDGTFPLERYNGCPFCGTPFELDKKVHYGQGSRLKVLELWREKELQAYMNDLLSSKTPLDATQLDSLIILLSAMPIPGDITIGMKETLMAVIDIYVSQNQEEKAQALFTSPTDILRYLWYEHTGFLQLIEPKTIIKRAESNNRHIALEHGKAVIAVQQQVRIIRSITKGLVFGVMDVESKEIIWLELPFYGQIAGNLDLKTVESLLAKLDSKLSIGHLLSIKARAQNLKVLNTPDADEVYSQQWAELLSIFGRKQSQIGIRR